MITKEEIDSKAGELSIHVSDVQRDYVFGWLLSGLFHQDNALSRLLVLKGGNAFRKAYFENARYSNDLDFSVQNELNLDKFARAITEACNFAQSQSGVTYLLEENRIGPKRASGDDGFYEARIYFKSFYDEGNITLKVKLDVREYDQIILPIQSRNLIHSYSDFDACQRTIRCLKLEELLAQKLVALLHRLHSPDLFDFVYSVFFQESLDISRLEVVSTFLKRTIHEPDPTVAKNLLLQLPFDVLAGFWEKFLVLPKISLIAFEDAAEKFRSAVGDFFALLAPQFGYARAGSIITYFPSQFRNLILEAGKAERLLRLSYDNFDRVIEPYSLSYKRRQDGIAREYFYGWDRTGGRSGNTGIKAFTADKVRSLEILEERFEPRFPIELGTSSGYFAGSGRFSESMSRRLKTTQPYGGVREFTVECIYCSKQFKRQKRDLSIKEHKDRFGNRCPGRRGRLVY